jgi:hypothetical protein
LPFGNFNCWPILIRFGFLPIVCLLRLYISCQDCFESVALDGVGVLGTVLDGIVVGAAPILLDVATGSDFSGGVKLLFLETGSDCFGGVILPDGAGVTRPEDDGFAGAA